MRRHPQLLHLCHLRPAAAIAARCWHHHASLSHEPRGHSHCRARPAWPNRHLVGAHRGHPQPQPDRCACVQCGRWWLGRAAGSRPCAGDVACHGWPVLWRQSSRSAPRPWLRGCLQAAPRDPGSGVRCVYRSSYGYTRVYWSQLPAVGAFGRVWWPWRTMRTQKVAFLTLWDPPRFGISQRGAVCICERGMCAPLSRRHSGRELGMPLNYCTRYPPQKNKRRSAYRATQQERPSRSARSGTRCETARACGKLSLIHI